MTTTNNNTVEQYKCPNCGGGLEFDSESQLMKCPYCDSEFTMEALEGYSQQETTEEEPQWEEYTEETGTTWQAGEKESLKRYICQSCGGEVITDETTVASKCPYCDNPVIIASELDGSFKPDLVIPFMLSKEDAKKALKSHFKGKKLLPSCFERDNHVEELTGVYVPFWLYDCEANGDIFYNATKVRSWSDSNYRYTKTSHFRVHRNGAMAFAKIPADGATKRDDALMESIEPYDYSKAVEFNTGYLSGYLAEKYDVTAEENKPRINKRIDSSMVDNFKNTIKGYTTCTPSQKNIHIQNGDIKYALLPVWILNTRYKDKLYTFGMNGQTGKFVGDLPIDTGKCVKYFAIAFGLSMIIGSIFGLFFF